MFFIPFKFTFTNYNLNYHYKVLKTSYPLQTYFIQCYKLLNVIIGGCVRKNCFVSLKKSILISLKQVQTNKKIFLFVVAKKQCADELNHTFCY